METVQGRFETKFEKGDGCWNWMASKNNKGYGQFKIAGKYQKAHRVAWMLYVGEIPGELCVLHRCDNPSCVNPSHLFIGTNTDNVRDCKDKGRRSDFSGENNSCAKLTEVQVRVIRAKRSEGTRIIDLAEEFGVSHQNISYIANRRRWAKV